MNRQCWVTAENQPLSKFCSKSGKWVVHNSGLHLFSADLVTTHGDWSCTWRPSWENNEFCDELRSLRRRQRSRKLWPRLRGGTRRRLMQRILSLFVLHNPPRELEQEAGIEVSCRWFRSSGRCTTNNTFVRFGTLLDRTYPMSSGSLKSRLKKTRSATIDSESAFLANVQVVFPVPHNSFRETARDLNPREKPRKVENVFPLENFGSRVVSI